VGGGFKNIFAEIDGVSGLVATVKKQTSVQDSTASVGKKMEEE